MGSALQWRKLTRRQPRPLSIERVASFLKWRAAGGHDDGGPTYVWKLRPAHSSLWSIQGMNELTKASDVTSEPKSEKRSRLSPTNYHFRRSRQLQGFGFRGFREMIFLKYGITAPNKIKMSVNKVEIYMLKSSIPAYWLIHDFKIWGPH